MDFKMTAVARKPQVRRTRNNETSRARPITLRVPINLQAPRLGSHLHQVTHINLVDRGSHMACEIWLRDGTAYRWGSS